MTRYAHVVDFRDWDRLSEVFAADATADYTPTGGISGSFQEVMSWLDRALAPWPVNLHAVSNVAITFDGPDRATFPTTSPLRWQRGPSATRSR